MTNAEKILELLESLTGPACDDCVSAKSGVEPRQQVNQICRRLESRGTVLRGESICVICGNSKQTNRIGETRVNERPAAKPNKLGATRHQSPEEVRNRLDRFCKGLLKKRFPGGIANSLAALISHLSDDGVLPIHQANMMHTIRSLRNAYVHEHLVLGDREYAVLENAWGIIEEWAEKTEPELWRLTRR